MPLQIATEMENVMQLAVLYKRPKALVDHLKVGSHLNLIDFIIYLTT